MDRYRSPCRAFLCSALLIGLIFTWGCAPGDAGSPVLQTDVPLHLEEHLDAASVEGSEVPSDIPAIVEWRFDESQPDWKRINPFDFTTEPARIVRIDDALRLVFEEENADSDGDLVGGLYVGLPDWERDDWAHIQVRARSEADVDEMGLILFFNLQEKSDAEDEEGEGPFEFFGEMTTVIHDGTVQTYTLRADWSGGRWEGPWKQLGLGFWADKEASIDILSVTVVPKEATYAGEPVGVRSEVRNRVYRRALYTRAPARVEYRVRVPEAGRLDLGLGVLREDAPVAFRITATPGGGKSETVLEETYDDKENWGQRSIDLSHLAGQTVDLTLETESPRPGTVALWAAPTLSSSRASGIPNVIFYVIDGGAADFMSVYGYNRRTTPNLERLAAEGALFERAYSNASWTKPSTASFMTSLQHSVLGGQTNWTDPVPEQIQTMAEHMHEAGYQTGVFIANPNAGTLSGLQRGVDVMRESWAQFAYFGGENYKESSRYLHEGFWEWREDYPGIPYWTHFQTVDVHEDFPAMEPFAGLFVGPEQRRTWREWNERLGEQGGHGVYSEAYEKTGLSRVDFFTLHQGMYDETMAHNDYQIGRLVERLKATGEWENTLLIIGGDHSTEAAMDDMGVAIQDSLTPEWNHPILRSSISRVPLIFVWPGRIEGGQRFSQPVSMIDVLPTVLDLTGLPQPEVAQGQSLAPLLRGEDGWKPRPVILDEFRVDPETGVMSGLIEVIDGRWGASLEINPDPEDEVDLLLIKLNRPNPLLIFDLWNDPFCLHSLHEERPDLVERYTAFLEAQWEAHQALGQRFTRSGEVALTPEQLETLRSLGYIQ
jgi:arylsulfatase A-like enzyme